MIHNEAIAIVIARVFLGILFLFQGYDAVFKIKIKGVVSAIAEPMRQNGVPNFIIQAAAFFTSYIQLLGGILLLIGLFKTYALCFLGIDIIIATLGFSIVQPMWDMRFVFPRLVVLIFLLLMPYTADIYSLDYLLIKF